MGDPKQYHLKFHGHNAANVDAYWEYKQIVGDDDGGTLFTLEEYEKYKKEVLPMRLQNRLYTSWTNSAGMDCKLVGPETPCFCEHRYRQHKTDFKTLPDERPIHLPCKVKGCRCGSYHYIPTLGGGQPIRCSCKHLANEHSEVVPYQCKKNICQKCAGFKSSYSCGCGEPYNTHAMLVENKDEREARGHPVGFDVPYKAMGGLTGFSSLAEGYQRLDPSGRGAPTEEFLGQEITSNDHAFLRANVNGIQAYRKAVKDYDHIDEDMAERMSAMRKPGESELDYYERRYQERQKSDRKGSKAIGMPQGVRPKTGDRKQIKPGKSAKKPAKTEEVTVSKSKQGTKGISFTVE